MASAAHSLPASDGRIAWFWAFLKEELAPYPGRAQTVTRMVLAATLIMLICMTFRIPYGFQGAVYALFITRESPRATLQTAWTILLVTAISLAYVLISAYFVISVPVLHFLWNIGTFLLAFFALSAITNYGASVIFAIVIAVAVPLWDQHVSAETNVENSLRLGLAAFVGLAVTAGVELAFRRVRPGDDIVLPIADQLSAVHGLLLCYAEGRLQEDAARKNVVRLALRGTSALRRALRRSDYSAEFKAQMGAVEAAAGRLLDAAATLTELDFEPSAADQACLKTLLATIENVRADLLNHRVPQPIQLSDEATGGQPLLLEMENVVALIPEAFASSSPADEALTLSDSPQPMRLLAPDAFVNPAHFQFALKGCLAASICYMLYNVVAWPGISTSVTTCLLTALTTIGASRQKQILRFAGALVGGVVIGMGSQIFLLPYVDSIGAFTVIFVVVTALSSWIITSSPRLSYFGLQVAFAYYLINLQEFAFQTSLSIARDRVVGVLLGLFAMWLVFDQLWGHSAAMEMKRAFVSNLRLLAQFMRQPLEKDLRLASDRSYSLRETINNGLDQVRALGDGVLFEFKPSRREDLALRAQIIGWQPRLRTILLTGIALWKYRAQLPGFQLPQPIAASQQDFDDDVAKALDGMADRMEGKTSPRRQDFASSANRLDQAIQTFISPATPAPLADQLKTFLALYRRIESLTLSLDREI